MNIHDAWIPGVTPMATAHECEDCATLWSRIAELEAEVVKCESLAADAIEARMELEAKLAAAEALLRQSAEKIRAYQAEYGMKYVGGREASDLLKAIDAATEAK